MNQSGPHQEIGCPHCGAQNASWDTNCWLCKQPLAATPDAVGKIPQFVNSADSTAQFGLSSLLLVITVICISLGLVAIAPGLIVPLVVIVVPALIRATAAGRVAAQPPSVTGKVAAFFTSLGLVLLIWVAGLVALGTACTLIVASGAAFDFTDDVVMVLIILTIAAVLSMFGFMGWLLYFTWPRR